MVFRYLLVVSETFYTTGAFTSTYIAKEEAKFDLAIACFVLVFKMQSVFSRCGFLSAAVSLEHIGISYLWKLSANSSKCFTANGKPNYDTITRINKTPHP